MVQSLTIRRPDDWHLHLRDGDMLKAVLPYSSSHFARAIIMPNLVPPVVTKADAEAYQTRILAALPDKDTFKPLMTLYLTEATDPSDVRAAYEAGLITAVKLYPAGATTNSASGVRNIGKVLPVLEVMAEIGLPLCIHGEVTTQDVDIFDREAVFIDTVLAPLRERLPTLKITLEHVTTKQGVDYIKAQDQGMGATFTTHHLMLNRNDMLVGGIKPHYYCLPILKRDLHRQALLEAATSGNPRFFLGTDSAPHATHTKEATCGCAGVFNAPNTMACLAQVFDEAGALDKLESFVSLHGPSHYGLDANADLMTLERCEEPQTVLPPIQVGTHTVTCFDPIRPIFWRVAD